MFIEAVFRSGLISNNFVINQQVCMLLSFEKKVCANTGQYSFRMSLPDFLLTTLCCIVDIGLRDVSTATPQDFQGRFLR